MQSLFDLYSLPAQTSAWADANLKYGLYLKDSNNESEEFVQYIMNAAIFYQQIELLQHIKYSGVNDTIKFQSLVQGVDWPYMADGSDWEKWRYFDELSLLAYYQKDFKAAFKAYSKLLKTNNFPAQHRERIISNGRWMDDPVEDQTYSNLHSQFEQLSTQFDTAFEAGKIKVLHFIFLQGYEFSLHHYLAIISAIQTLSHKLHRVHIYNDIEPQNNDFWDKMKKLSKVHIIPVFPPKYLNKNKVFHKAHQADVIRLVALKHLGGVYMDLDMLTLRDFSSIIDPQNDITLVQEDPDKLSNAFICSSSTSTFLKMWLKEYETKWGNADIDSWGGLSVQFPFKLAQKMKEDVKVNILDTPTFLPFNYFHTEFFTSNKSFIDFSRSFAVHLWDTEQQKRGILPKTVDEMKNKNAMFWKLFGHYFESNTTSKDVRKARLLISIEGNIGSGKSTLLDVLKLKTFKIPYIVLQEDVKAWTSFVDSEGNDILQKYYKDQEKFGYCFQSLVLVSRMNKLVQIIKENPQSLIIIERSYLTDQQIFAKSLHEKGLMTEIEWLAYNQCVEMLNSMIDTKPDLIVYNVCSPDVCIKRIAKRARKGEENISFEYIDYLHNQHNEWLIGGTTNAEILFMDGDLEMDSNDKQTQIDELVATINKKIC